MENLIIKPHSNNFTVYTKSNCVYCLKLKQLLKDYDINFIEVNCDEYLTENKNIFLLFIKSITNKNYNTFPMVFDKGVFIGGFTETNKYLEKEYVDFNDFF
jgi:glutaredoxin